MPVVESSIFSSSSPLSSLVSAPSSNPSIQPVPPVGTRAKVTYSRKPIDAEQAHTGGLDSSSSVAASSSQPASPSEPLFDSPMRSYGRNAASRTSLDTAAHDGADDLTITADDSPATTAHAANSAIKPGPSSLFRRVDSHPSRHSDNDDDEDDQHAQASTDSPAVNRTKKFHFGVARAIFDSDSDSDADGTASKPTSLSANSANKNDDNDAIIARIRAQAAQDADSDPFTGSLSSVPPSSSQAQSSLQRDSLHENDDDEAMVDDDQEGSITLTRRRGTKISAMRGKRGQQTRSKFSSSSDKDDSAASEQDDGHTSHHRKSRTFKLISSASSASATPADENDNDNDNEAGPSSSNAALTRREKMEALAARARKAHGEAETAAGAEPDPLLDAFFGGGSPGRIPSRSPSLDIQSSDEDEHNDAMPAFMAPQAETAKPKTKSKSKKAKSVAVERDILSDLEDGVDRANANASSKRSAASKEKAPPKVKPLSKKELETMHRQTARLARENRTRLLPTHHQKKTIGLGDLFNKITASESLRASASNSADSAPSADRSQSSTDQPSSQIPSGQSKSQHASDPIESDPIPERSSPQSNYVSSPVVPVSRQQERRLGLDQSTSSANILQANAGRVAGLATKPDEAAKMRQLLASTDDADDQDLPDLATLVQQSRDQQEAARKQQQLRKMKLRLLEQSRQKQPVQPRPTTDKVQTDANDDDDDDLLVYEPGAVLASKHNLPTTPGRKRPTDLLYRELGMRPGKTPPSRKSGPNANGSPSAVMHNGDNVENADDADELGVTDSQLRSAGKGLFVASDRAAGHVPATQPPPASTQAQQAQEHAHPPSTQAAAARAGPLKMTQAQLNATLMRKMQTQSLKARSHKDGKDAPARGLDGSGKDAHGRSAAPDVKQMLERLQTSAGVGGHSASGDQDDNEDDPDFIMPAARDAESVIGSDVDMGSASEAEAVDDADDLIDMGSADEDDENQDVEGTGIRDTIEEADEEDDSEKENAPPASQQSLRSHASPSLSRGLLPSRAVMDDDEDELPVPRATARRARRSALADDDGEDDEDENSLQPGPFEHSRGNTHADEAEPSQNRARVPLGDISSQSIDQSMPFSRSNTSSPAIQHAPAPGAATGARRDSLIFPPTAGHDEDESFRTDDIPSQAASLGRFFEPTMPPPSTAKQSMAAPQAAKSFWDQTQTQTQTQSQSQNPSQFPTSTRAPYSTHVPRELARDPSANSALGAFFQDTQQDELRGESLDIFENPKNADGKAHGFTQFFADGTPPPSADARGTGGGSTAAPSVWDASTMPPPKSIEIDAFAALRRAQMGEAMDLLDPTPSVLPSFDESQAEREAYAQAQADGQRANQSPEKMYMNRDGFFTQTKPSQQTGLWSQYDSQSQSQSQNPNAANAAASSVGGVWPSPAAPSASMRRGSEASDISHARNASVSDEDEDQVQPVQLKRLRRGGAHNASAETAEQAGDDGDSDAASEVDENGPPSSQPEPRPRTAFDVLREGPLRPDLDASAAKGKKRKSAFIEGEAEESEDEELGGQKRGDGGGLKGVFGDDNGSDSGAEDDEDDEDDADAADLQELVDNERELDEAEKDEVARARFREDMEAKDREELEMHQKAIQGGFRTRRGRAGLNGIDAFLDEDAEDEDDRRKIALQSSAGWKKRKLLDGTEDGMDALAAHEEAQPFVQSYAATHRIDHESEKYDFLAVAEADKDNDDDEDEDEDEDENGSDEDKDDDEEAAGEGVVEEDAFGPVVTKQPKTMRYDDVRAVLRERRKAKKRTALDDDEGDENAELRVKDNEWDSDEDDNEARLAAALKDRIKGVASTPAIAAQPSAAVHPPKRKQPSAVQYGRKALRTSEASHHGVAPMDVDTQDADGDDADDAEPGSLMDRLLHGATARPSSYRSGSSMAVDTLEDAEPEWGNDANIVRAPKAAAGTSQSSSGSGSGSRLSGGSKAGSSPFGAKKSKAGSGSMLVKQGIMRRQSGFSSSSSSR